MDWGILAAFLLNYYELKTRTMNAGVLNCGQRISVVGTSGSGNTTLARKISQLLAVHHVELDALHWEANWTEASIDVFRKRVEQSLSSNSWVVDGTTPRYAILFGVGLTQLFG